MSVLTENGRRGIWHSLARLRDWVVKDLRIRKPTLYHRSDPSEL
jgi:hypothetical protein